MFATERRFLAMAKVPQPKLWPLGDGTFENLDVCCRKMKV